jgi:hypothetical protein
MILMTFLLVAACIQPARANEGHAYAGETRWSDCDANRIARFAQPALHR